jgi:hypothetical protein
MLQRSLCDPEQHPRQAASPARRQAHPAVWQRAAPAESRHPHLSSASRRGSPVSHRPELKMYDWVYIIGGSRWLVYALGVFVLWGVMAWKGLKNRVKTAILANYGGFGAQGSRRTRVGAVRQATEVAEEQGCGRVWLRYDGSTYSVTRTCTVF